MPTILISFILFLSQAQAGFMDTEYSIDSNDVKFQTQFDFVEGSSSTRVQRILQEYEFESVYSVKQEGNSILHMIAMIGDIKSLKMLIKNTPVDINKKNVRGETPLLWSVWFKNGYDVAKFLLESGADVDTKDHTDLTALHYASFHGHFPQVELLIHAGAYTRQKDVQRRTALHFSFLQFPNPKIVRALIQAGADVNARDFNRKTPLHYAMPKKYIADSHNFVESVRILIKAGVNVNARDNYNKTALYYAVPKKPYRHSHKALQIVRLLIQAGVDINFMINEDSGDTLLHRAVKILDLNMVKFLVESGADLQAQNDRGYSPLDEAYALVSEDGQPAKEIANYLRSKQARTFRLSIFKWLAYAGSWF